MKAVVAAFNQEKALVGAFSAITNLRMELFQALLWMYFINLHPISGSVRIILDMCCMLWKKRCRFETSFSHRKRQRLHFHEIIQIIQVAHRNSKQLNGAKSSSVPRSLLWYFLSDFWPTILCTNIFKGLLKICFSLRNNNVYLVIFFFACFVRLETLQNWKCILRVINLPQMFPLSQFKIPSI